MWIDVFRIILHWICLFLSLALFLEVIITWLSWYLFCSSLILCLTAPRVVTKSQVLYIITGKIVKDSLSIELRIFIAYWRWFFHSCVLNIVTGKILKDSELLYDCNYICPEGYTAVRKLPLISGISFSSSVSLCFYFLSLIPLYLLK